MTKQEVIEYFGSPSKTGRALKITRQAVYDWPDIVPLKSQWRIELMTHGALKSELTKQMEREHLELIREKSSHVD
jgi:hypothetical protein